SVGQRRRVTEHAGNVQARCHGGSALLIAHGFVATEVMVQMGGAQLAAVAGRQRAQRRQQRGGVGAARNGDQQPLAGGAHPIVDDRALHTLEEGDAATSLHSEPEFDIIAAALQMTFPSLLARRTLSMLLATALLHLAIAARADDEPPAEARTAEEAAEAA